MVRKAWGAALLVVLVLITASSAQAEPAAQSATSPAAVPSVWRATLIGLAVGAGAGAGVGWMRSNFHAAECATLACKHTLEVGTMTPIGAVVGAGLGFLLHQHHDSRDAKTSRSTSFALTPSYSSTQKGIFMRALF
jgi:hypothetical protein